MEVIIFVVAFKCWLLFVCWNVVQGFEQLNIIFMSPFSISTTVNLCRFNCLDNGGHFNILNNCRWCRTAGHTAEVNVMQLLPFARLAQLMLIWLVLNDNLWMIFSCSITLIAINIILYGLSLDQIKYIFIVAKWHFMNAMRLLELEIRISLLDGNSSCDELKSLEWIKEMLASLCWRDLIRCFILGLNKGELNFD